MFALKASNLRGLFLDCVTAPASFKAEATAEDRRAVSSSPLCSLFSCQLRKDLVQARCADWRAIAVAGRRDDLNSVTSASTHSAPWKRATLTRWWPSWTK